MVEKRDKNKTVELFSVTTQCRTPRGSDVLVGQQQQPLCER